MIEMYYNAEKNHVCFEKFGQLLNYVKTIIVLSSTAELYEAIILECIIRFTFIDRRIRTSVNYIGTNVSVEITGLDIHTKMLRDRVCAYISEMNVNSYQEFEKRAFNDLHHMMENHFTSFVYNHYPEVMHLTGEKGTSNDIIENSFSDILCYVMQADFYQFRYYTDSINCFENIQPDEVSFALIKDFLDHPIGILPAKDTEPQFDMHDGYTVFSLRLPDDFSDCYSSYSLINFMLGQSSVNMLLREFRWKRACTYKAYSSYMYNSGVIIGEIAAGKLTLHINSKDFLAIIAEAFTNITESDAALYLKEKEILENANRIMVENDIQNLFRRVMKKSLTNEQDITECMCKINEVVSLLQNYM